MADISVLQIGATDWTPKINHNHIDWHYTAVLDLPTFLAQQRDPYVLEQTYVLLTDNILDSTLLSSQISEWPAYRTLYFAEDITADFQHILDERRAFHLPEKAPEAIISRILTDLQLRQVGFQTRFSETQFIPLPPNNTHFKREGRFSAQFNGDFGTKWQQIGQLKTYATDFAIAKAHDVWLDYEQSGTVEVQLEFVFFNQGKIQTTQTISGDALRRLNTIGDVSDYQDYQVLVYARGNGGLDLHVLHQRQSRHGFGLLLPGDHWELTEENEEIMSYFNPGDRKGPLIVNFSGLRLHVDGFEMLGPMRELGTPFLLFTDTRTQGGAFEIGTKHYEERVVEIIHQAMVALHLSAQEVILTGYSMGSLPAIYYAADIKPGAIVIAKPIINIGTMTANPEFPREFNQDWTLDLRRYLAGRMALDDTEALNQILWEHIQNVDWSKIPVSLFTMSQDEYDGQSLQQLLTFWATRDVALTHVIAEGPHTAKIPEMVAFITAELTKLRDDLRQEAN